MSVEPIPAASAQGLDPGKEARAAEGVPIIPALDGFRALAIYAIVVLHLIGVFVNPEGNFGRILTYGPLPNAVDVLFIISGFVVFLPAVARGGRFGAIGAYAVRRAARLLPAFWVAIGLVVLMIAVWPASPAPTMPSLAEIGAHVTGLHVPVHFFDQDFLLGLGIDGPLWTLSLEVTFYLLLPLVAGVYYRHPFAGLLIAVAISVGWKVGAENLGEIAGALGLAPSPERLAFTQSAAYSQFPAFTAQFALGMTAAWLVVKLPDKVPEALLRRRAAQVQALSALALIPLFYLFGLFAREAAALAPTQARGEILLTLAIPLALTTFMLATALAPPRMQIPFALPFARSLGDISYGAYLMHFPLILFYVALVASLPEGAFDVLTSIWVGGPIVLAASIGYGYLSGIYLERPIRRWAHRYGRRARTTRAAVEAPTRP